ncbi:MAG: glycosyltransferase family 2 protein [Myxococcales bacterium]|nr:glycosyltransferase family 2 protein [Myxococcales bacterium]
MTTQTPPPRISVVMTAYNHSQYIPEAIESILTQDAEQMEFIIVDDGSEEDIAGVVPPYKERVHLIHQRNAGLGAARNTGLWASRGEYVAFCDSDDIQRPLRLSAHASPLCHRAWYATGFG